ncbi:MAG: single-stranded DNA-binding protein [Lentisphaerae bacterium]|jgi:single-strand DNA-binding protein|nr:single-stranded DNA-binding protein [Lentisphaerota bacterium]
MQQEQRQGDKTMENLNKVMLMGHLTRAPKMKALQSGVILCEFGLATNRYYRTQTGESREEVCFVEITVMGNQADFCHRNLTKGSPVFIDGRLKLDKWVDKTTGKNASRLRVIANEVLFLAPPAGPPAASNDRQDYPQYPPQQRFQQPPQQSVDDFDNLQGIPAGQPEDDEDNPLY